MSKTSDSPETKRSFLVSMPDFRLLVGSTGADNEETTLVVPQLLSKSVRYARLLVEEEQGFVEHAVALVDPNGPSHEQVIGRALRAARPTRVTFLLSLPTGRIKVSPEPGDGLEVAQIAAAGATSHCLQRATPESAVGQARFDFFSPLGEGHLTVEPERQFFQVQVS